MRTVRVEEVVALLERMAAPYDGGPAVLDVERTIKALRQMERVVGRAVPRPAYPHTGEGLGREHATAGASLLDTCAQSVYCTLLLTVVNPNFGLNRDTFDSVAKIAFDAAQAFVDESERRQP